MNAFALFQDFSPDGPQRKSVRAEDLPGFEEGLAQGRKQAQSEIDDQTAAMVQTLTDMTFSYAEARQDIVDALHPLFDVIARQILPQTAPLALVEDLIATLDRSRHALSNSPAAIRVHPDQIAALQSRIPEDLSARVFLQEDPTLSPLTAMTGIAGRERIFDRASLIESVADIFDALTQPSLESISHG